jgi:hypothetical protein
LQLNLNRSITANSTTAAVPRLYLWTTHVSKNLTSSTSRQQVVFALLVPSCQQVWNKLLATCNNLVDIIRLVARLFQQVRYSRDITILLQPCVVNLYVSIHLRSHINNSSSCLTGISKHSKTRVWISR